MSANVIGTTAAAPTIMPPAVPVRAGTPPANGRAGLRSAAAHLGYADGAALLRPDDSPARAGATAPPVTDGGQPTAALTTVQVMAQANAVLQGILQHRLQAVATAEQDQGKEAPAEWSQHLVDIATTTALTVTGGLLTSGAIRWLSTLGGKAVVGAVLGQLPGVAGDAVAAWQSAAERTSYAEIVDHAASALRSFLCDDPALVEAAIQRRAAAIPAGANAAQAFFRLQQAALPDIMVASAAQVNFGNWPANDPQGVIASLALLGALQQVAGRALSAQYLGSVTQWCRLREQLALAQPHQRSLDDPFGLPMDSLAGRSNLHGVLTLDCADADISAANLQGAESGIHDALVHRADLQSTPLREVPNVSLLLRDGLTRQPIVWVRDGQPTQWLADETYWRRRAEAAGQLAPADQCRPEDAPILESVRQRWLNAVLQHPFADAARNLQAGRPRLSDADAKTEARLTALSTPPMGM